jgi:NADPH-dependent 2,4-dienoyl-CoA reductase/sulfur reductase-like enzyme
MACGFTLRFRRLGMNDARVLIVGAGLAGLAAAVELARAGVPVLVVDQASDVGGAIHRQPLTGVRSIAGRAQKRRWNALWSEVCAMGERIEIRCATRFGGMDHTGAALLTGPSGMVMRPAALVLATGARERVQPRPGWTLPGVQTAGAIQMCLKTLAEPPQGRVLLAGSGPLLLAVGAELTRLGRPPVAIVEAARPMRPLMALGLPLPYLTEAARHMSRLLAARVPLLMGADLRQIVQSPDGLMAHIDSRKGARVIEVDVIGLHDGIRPNNIGLGATIGLPVVQLGDCREALGARAALADGRLGGATLAAQLTGRSAPADTGARAREVAAQALLARIYAHDGARHLADLPPETVICRCENRTIADLRALGPAPTDREIRLNGRFAMGACQGRFCADWVSALTRPGTPPAQLGATRWPPRPISVAQMLAATDSTESDSR